MNDATENLVESKVTEPTATPSTESNPAETSTENVPEPIIKTKEISVAEKPNIEAELRSGLEQIKSSLAKQSEENAAVLKQLSDNTQNFYKNVVPFLNSLGKKVTVLDKKFTDVENALKRLHGERLDKREQLVKEQSDTIAKQQDSLKELSGTFNKLHDCMIRYQNDVLFKTQKEILEDLIQLSDQVRCNILDQEQNNNYDSLLESMKQIGKWIDASLERSKMHKFEDCADGNTAIDKRRQEVVEIAETEIAEKDGCFVTHQPGYLWTIPFVGSVETMLSEKAPQTFEFVFRPEQVVKLKYKK